MRANFASHLEQNFPFLSGKKLLVAVSGGLDSMVLCDLLQQSRYEMALAHVNFKLRGDESDADENFVTHYADTRKLRCFTTAFDTDTFAADYKLSIQQAARLLRYQWFEELLDTEGFDFVLTAHQANDVLETFFINLSRSSGIAGLTGIPEQNGRIIRPLLPFSRDEIQAFAQAENLSWREDSSNASDDYLRNRIRHHLIPELGKISPNFAQAIAQTQHHLRQARDMAQDASVAVFKKVAQEADESLHIDLRKLSELKNPDAYLHDWLQPYGFTAWEDVYRLRQSQGGKKVLSGTHQLLKHGHFLILSALKPHLDAEVYEIAQSTAELKIPLKLRFETVAAHSRDANNAIFVDASKLEFPLTLRRWREGDRFQPAGMDGKSKKVSKFFKDSKLSLPQKEQSWLLCSGESIVWIIGQRQDARFLVQPQTTNILKITHTP